MSDAAEEITKPIDVEAFRRELERDKTDKVADVRRSLHLAASSAMQAGNMLKGVYEKISEALQAIDSIPL